MAEEGSTSVSIGKNEEVKVIPSDDSPFINFLILNDLFRGKRSRGEDSRRRD